MPIKSSRRGAEPTNQKPLLFGVSLEKTGKLLKIFWVEVRHCPKAHSSGIEAHYVVTSESPVLNGNLPILRGRPDKNVNDMLPATIDKRSDGSSAEIIKPSTH